MQLDEILENRLVDLIAGGVPYSPALRSQRHGSDAEIVEVNGHLIAITTDTISEELSTGIYDPYLGGWMAITANLSDIAAVGAEPVGILLSLVIPEEWDDGQIREMASGIKASCNAHGCGILGGDTNTGNFAVLGATAIGTLQGKPMSRIGLKAGDVLYTTGRAGLGNAFALASILDLSGIDYRPVAKIREGMRLREIANVAMDTSDGLMATLDELARVNSVAIEITNHDIIHPSAMEMAEALDVPPMVFAAAIHGDFELVFSVDEGKKHLLDDLDFDVIPIGHVHSGSGVYYNGHLVPTGEIRNLYTQANDMEEYMERLVSLISTVEK